jgi:exosortase H (IPTLxxWG-CTERM-specific)
MGKNKKAKSWRYSGGLPLSKRFQLSMRRNRAVFYSWGIFLACVIIFVIAYPRLVSSSAFSSLSAGTAKIIGLTLNLFHTAAIVDGGVVSSNNFSVEIIGECTGIVPLLIFISAVIAYPCRIKQKLIGIAIGTGAIYLLNLVRIVSLFYVGSAFPVFFSTAHLSGWQGLTILLTLILWLYWVRKWGYNNAP